LKFIGSNSEYISLVSGENQSLNSLTKCKEDEFLLIWFKSNESRMKIDGKSYLFNNNEIICLTEYHILKDIYIKNARIFRFNRSFYCILENDNEVSCKGILFFGASNIPVIQVPKADIELFDTVFEMFKMEITIKDHLQLEMLQMMLKRFLILCTRVYKNQENYENLNYNQQNIIREYNYLVEHHFREKQTVKEYADLLFRSPKTLANLFSKLDQKSPLQFIHDRILIEARRLLSSTDKSIKEVAYYLGFEDQQSFSRFFKNKEGISPINYKKLE